MSAGETMHTSATGGQKAGNDVRMSLVPIRELMEVAELYGKGAKKYDDFNWARGFEWSKCYDALWRHMAEFWAGNEIDDGEGGTGLPHLTCAAFHVFTLLYFSKHHRALDDRHIAPAQPVGTLLDGGINITPKNPTLIFDTYHIHTPLADTSSWTITGGPKGAEGVVLDIPTPDEYENPKGSTAAASEQNHSGVEVALALSSWTVPEYTPHYPYVDSRAVRLTEYLRGSQWQSEKNGIVYWFVDGEWWFMHPDDEREDPWHPSVTEDDGATVPSNEGPFVIYQGSVA